MRRRRLQFVRILSSLTVFVMEVTKTYTLSVDEETKKLGRFLYRVHKQRYKDSNLEMTESESVALPFGDSAS